MGNSSNSDTSTIFKAIQQFLINDKDKDSFATQLKACGYNNPKVSSIYLETIKLIEEIKSAGINYFLILVQHPSIKSHESRYLMTWCSHEVIRRYRKICERIGVVHLKKFKNYSPEEKRQLNQDFLIIYSKSIGRLDSFSEACLRYIDSLEELPGKNGKSGFFSVNITDEPFSFNWVPENKKYEIKLNIEKKYYEQLCSVRDENASNNLLELFFRIFFEEYKQPNRDALIFNRLRKENFELIRNGLISGVSSKIHLEESTNLITYYDISKRFFCLDREVSELGYNDLERFLGVIQTYAMWAYLTGMESHFYFKVDEVSNVGVYTYSDSESEEKVTAETRKNINDLIFKYVALLYEEIFTAGSSESNNIKSTVLNSIAKVNLDAKKTIEGDLLKRINKDEIPSFNVFLDIVSQLRDIAKHEGKSLFFNIALGNDEYLRAYFAPLHPKFSNTNDDNKNNDNKWSISFEYASIEKKLENEISRICSLILGNYSFLQEEDVWLCFSFNQTNVIELRYLAKIKHKISYSINQLNGFDYIKRFTAVTKNLPKVFIAKIYKNKKSLVGYMGNTLLKHTGEDWNLGEFANQSLENPILKAYLDINTDINEDINKTFGVEDGKIQILFRTMDSISKEDGLGAMFVILKNLKNRNSVVKYIADMTEVIEMVEDWKISNLKDEEYLYKLAIQDGATVIDLKDRKIKGRKLISNTAKGKVFDPQNFRPKGDDNPDNQSLLELWKKKDSPYQWDEWGKWYEWGARRMTGAALAYQFSGYVEVFIISSDGDIYYLNGKKICKLDRKTQKFV